MYEILIIGAGAAGIEAAKHAAGAGKKTALIDLNEQAFGGTCLNRGCIPTKLYLYKGLKEKDPSRIFAHKNAVVASLKKAALSFLQKQGVDLIWGNASFSDEHTVSVGSEKIRADHIIVATGSAPRDCLGIDAEKIIFAEHLFSLEHLPERFLIVGAGAIGLEFASLLNNLGKKVTVIEKELRILPGFEEMTAQRMKSLLNRSGITIETSAIADNRGFADVDLVLLAAGRRPETTRLNLDEAGIHTDPDGRIIVDETCRTNRAHIYACGDVSARKMYAYIGEYQARVCVDTICGKPAACSFRGIPEGVFTIPQVAQVGLTETDAKKEGIECRVLKTHFAPYSAAVVYDDTAGYLKVLVDSDDRIRGASIISGEACDLISHFAFAIRNNLTRKALAESIFIHPARSEILTQLARQA